ncbi:MAG: G8 domain-containing protein [Tepidisphaeraceae bacterium]
MKRVAPTLVVSFCLFSAAAARADAPATRPAVASSVVSSVGSGAWSAPDTWSTHRIPAAGDTVLIRSGDQVTYDVVSPETLFAVHVAGTLDFATDRDTQMNVGLLLVKPGDDGSDGNFVGNAHPGHAHHHMAMPDAPPATLRIGSTTQPVAAEHRALIRLTHVPGTDANAYPALIDMGGTLELHGSPVNHSWMKLRSTASAGSTQITLADAVTGWRAGDRVILTTTILPKMFDGNGGIIDAHQQTQTEERTIRSIEGQLLTLDRPLAYDHFAEGDYRGEVADLSRNIVIESADPESQGGALRGHTMIHGGSHAAIDAVEFRHLGKPGQLGRYALHFHAAGDSLRGSSVMHCSIWDSDNRWITVHGTNYLVIRDNVGYRSLGHGFFCEDGTEIYNVFDENLAVQALHAPPLPEQALPFDKNDGAGFWWANSLNTFTNNVAVECDQYGYRFEMDKPPIFDPTLPVRQPDGTQKDVDVRTLPFVRFEANEAHSNRRYAMNLGGFRLVAGDDGYSTAANGDRAFDRSTTLIGDVGDVGPDLRHPFVIRDFKVGRSFWAFHSAAPSVYIDGLDVFDTTYGIWRTRMDHHQYKNISFKKMGVADIYNPWGGNNDFTQDFNKSVKLHDDLPPQTVITDVIKTNFGDYRILGTTSDNGTVTGVTVNGHAARAFRPNFAEWSIDLPAAEVGQSLTARAVDQAGNVEQTPHVVPLPASR